jgi:hypothetical protein
MIKLKNIFVISLTVLGIVSSCKKERTCTCETKDVETTTRTPRTRNGYTPPATSDVYANNGKSSTTWGKVKKSEVKIFGDCLDGTTTSSNSYTTTQTISTPTTVPPSTFVINTFVTYTVDVKITNETTLSNCEIE